MGDLPLTIYFDFQTTSGNSIAHDTKMVLTSYCQIYFFHPDLKIDKLIIYRSLQQNAEEIYSVDQFS